ncbi:RNA-binding protein, partial [Helicobacter sp. MIT 14-3879]|uniref:RNA recognition motif domain-containing protein n=1 Tax=Helicobacter sp. MIT 14-3879 TaxID=2040649 RepID=UPI000E3AC156
AQYGDVLSIKIINDKQTNKLKGYAFVEMEADNADCAIEMLNQTVFLGRVIKVSGAKNTQKSLP